MYRPDMLVERVIGSPAGCTVGPVVVVVVQPAGQGVVKAFDLAAQDAFYDPPCWANKAVARLSTTSLRISALATRKRSWSRCGRRRRRPVGARSRGVGEKYPGGSPLSSRGPGRDRLSARHPPVFSRHPAPFTSCAACCVGATRGFDPYQPRPSTSLRVAQRLAVGHDTWHHSVASTIRQSCSTTERAAFNRAFGVSAALAGPRMTSRS